MAIVRKIEKDYTFEGEELKIEISKQEEGKIITSLVKNIYSQSLSFIREIISNALDSDSTLPINVTIKGLDLINIDSSYEFIVQDYGRGMSIEDIENIYCKLGQSDKRTSNNYMGSYGYGSKSPLKYVDEKFGYFTVETNKNNLKQIFTVSSDKKEGYKINFLIKNANTTDIGTKVIVPILSEDVPKIQQFICDNFYFVNNEVNFNFDYSPTLKIEKSFDNFFVQKEYGRRDLKKTIVIYKYLVYITDIEFTKIVPIFNIGELNMTSSRENVDLSSYDLIKEKIKERIDYVKNLNISYFEKKLLLGKDIENVIFYKNRYNSSRYYESTVESLFYHNKLYVVKNYDDSQNNNLKNVKRHQIFIDETNLTDLDYCWLKENQIEWFFVNACKDRIVKDYKKKEPLLMVKQLYRTININNIFKPVYYTKNQKELENYNLYFNDTIELVLLTDRQEKVLVKKYNIKPFSDLALEMKIEHHFKTWAYNKICNKVYCLKGNTKIDFWDKLFFNLFRDEILKFTNCDRIISFEKVQFEDKSIYSQHSLYKEFLEFLELLNNFNIEDNLLEILKKYKNELYKIQG